MTWGDVERNNKEGTTFLEYNERQARIQKDSRTVKQKCLLSVEIFIPTGWQMKEILSRLMTSMLLKEQMA